MINDEIKKTINKYKVFYNALDEKDAKKYIFNNVVYDYDIANEDDKVELFTYISSLFENKDIIKTFKVDKEISYKLMIEKSKIKDFNYFLKQKGAIKLPEYVWNQLYDNLFDTNEAQIFSTEEEYNEHVNRIHEFSKKFICENSNVSINRVIIAGGREFDNYKVLEKIVDEVLSKEEINNNEIISGHAKGADTLGERYASEHSYKCTLFPADWSKYGKKAGPIRNKEMLEYAKKENPLLIAFWNGTSKGTKNMINISTKAGIKVFIYNYVTKNYIDI